MSVLADELCGEIQAIEELNTTINKLEAENERLKAARPEWVPVEECILLLVLDESYIARRDKNHSASEEYWDGADFNWSQEVLCLNGGPVKVSEVSK